MPTKEPGTGIVVSKEVAMTEHTTNSVMINGKEYVVAKRVNVPTLKHNDNEWISIRIDAPIRVEVNEINEEVVVAGVKQIATREAEINVVRVTELYSGQEMEYVCNTMTADNFRSTYPDNGYVGRTFAVYKRGLAPGKRYKETEVVEIAEK